jgi:hypothetical protein
MWRESRSDLVINLALAAFPLEMPKLGIDYANWLGMAYISENTKSKIMSPQIQLSSRIITLINPVLHHLTPEVFGWVSAG